MSFSDFICNEICSKLFTTEYKLGNEIIKEGDVADKMFIVIKGLVGIYKNHTNDCVDVVGPSNTIGETALESDCLRTATVIALENVLALQLTKEDYNSIVIKQKHKQRFAIINLLKKSQFFRILSTPGLKTLLGLC
jgi:cAMP-binding proteins - catabolite gene activator and regulatory subunit of cAMP-dependent protein kinases